MRRFPLTPPLHCFTAGDWVAHQPGAPSKVLAAAPTLKAIERILTDKEIRLDDVEVYQVPTVGSDAFVGGGTLEVLRIAD